MLNKDFLNKKFIFEATLGSYSHAKLPLTVKIT